MNSSKKSEPRNVPPNFIMKVALQPCLWAAILLIGGWLGFISVRFFQYDPFNTDHVVRDDSGGRFQVAIYTWGAVLLTLVLIPATYLVVRSRLYVIRFGEKVWGEITGFGLASYKGARKVVVQYEAGGKLRTYESSEGNAVGNWGIGESIPVFVHPKNPNRAVIIWSRDAEEI